MAGAEHRAYGFPFPDTSSRLETLEEQIEIIHRSWGAEPFDFHGRQYQLEGCDARPKPAQRPHPNLIVGGGGGPRSIAVAARWADEYNTVFASAGVCGQRRDAVVRAWREAGRDEESMVFSLMTRAIVGTDNADVLRRARAAMAHIGDDGEAQEWLAQNREEWVVGTPEEALDQLGALQDAGVQRVMLQHLAPDDLTMVALLGDLAARLAS